MKSIWCTNLNIFPANISWAIWNSEWCNHINIFTRSIYSAEVKCVQYPDFDTHAHTQHSDGQLSTFLRCWTEIFPHLLERNFWECSEKILLSPHLFFRDLLSIDNVGIIVICGTDLIMGQYTNIRYLAQLSAMEEYSLWEKACEFADASSPRSRGWNRATAKPRCFSSLNANLSAAPVD